jgi:hypothetical protein
MAVVANVNLDKALRRACDEAIAAVRTNSLRNAHSLDEYPLSWIVFLLQSLLEPQIYTFGLLLQAGKSQDKGTGRRAEPRTATTRSDITAQSRIKSVDKCSA